MRFTKKISLFILMLSTASLPLLGQNGNFEAKIKTIPNQAQELLSQYLTTAQLLELPSSAIYNRASQQKSTGWVDFTLEVNDLRLDFGLTPNDLRSDDYQSVAYYEKGITENTHEYEVVTYKGILNYQDENKVRMSITKSGISGYFFKEGIKYQIRPVTDFITDTELSGFLLFKTEDIVDQGGLFCTDEQEVIIDQDNAITPSIRSSAQICRTVRIAIEGDFPYFLAFSGSSNQMQAAEQQTHIIINEVEGAYDFGDDEITFEIAHTGIWTENIYTGITNGNDLLDASRNWWAFADAISSPIDRDMMHLFTGVDIVNNNGSNLLWGTVGSNNGTSGLNAVCNLPPPPYYNAHAVSEYLTVTSHGNVGLQAELTAHEIGHNFGAFHLVNCGSGVCIEETIMCGCIDDVTNFFFSPVNRNRILANTECLSSHDCPPPCTGSCCATSLSEVDRLTLGNFSKLIQSDLNNNFIIAQRAFIKHEKEILHIIEGGNDNHQRLKNSLTKLKKEGRNLLIKSFAFGQETKVEKQHFVLINQFLKELKIVASDKLQEEIERVQQHLPVIINKELKTAIIDFDQAISKNHTTIDESYSINKSFDVQLLNSLANPATIRFKAPNQEGCLSILLYDLNGRKVKTLIEDVHIYDGHYLQEVDKNMLTPGVYFIHLSFSTEEGKEQKILKLPVLE